MNQKTSWYQGDRAATSEYGTLHEDVRDLYERERK